MASKFSYTVDDDTFHVRIFSTDQVPPVIFQPNYPDNRPWESKEAAAKWAEECIAGLENPPPAPTPEVVDGEIVPPTNG